MIQRDLVKTIKKSIKPGFISIIYGPRRVGKTVLLQQLISQFTKEKNIVFNGDTQETRDLLSSTSETVLTNTVKNADIVVIDEAQRIENIALSLKILIDKFPEKKIFVTGSSSIDIAKGIKETLTGRTNKFRLYPLSTKEITSQIQKFQKSYLLEEQLIYGGYPYLQSLNTSTEKQEYLKSITEDYLFRDILLLKEIERPDNLRKLTTLLAFQIGSEVSLNELANNLNIDVKTVQRYISLLKQGFIIFEHSAYSTNLRSEVSKTKKYYFWDLGIRNAVTEQFLPLNSRTDVGSLWENFLAVERLKKQEYSQTPTTNYFWRSYDQAEIDWIEINQENIQAYEFKWKNKKARTPKAFKEAYKTEVHEISKNNYLDFIL